MGTIPVVLFISVSAVWENNDPKYIHLLFQKFLLFYLYLQMETNKS